MKEVQSAEVYSGPQVAWLEGWIRMCGVLQMTQKLRVLARLRVAPLTAYEAIRELSVGRLAARIEELRNQGHDIHTEQVESVNVYGDQTRYGRYHLIKEAH